MVAMMVAVVWPDTHSLLQYILRHWSTKPAKADSSSLPQGRLLKPYFHDANTQLIMPLTKAATTTHVCGSNLSRSCQSSS